MAVNLELFPGGWVRVRVPELGDSEIAVRFKRFATDRLGVSDVEVHSASHITIEALRSIPLARIEAWANAPKLAGFIRADLEAEPDMDFRSAVATNETVRRMAEELAGIQLTPTTAELRVSVPKDRRKPDAFYKQIADIFSRASATTQNPAARLATANRVPVTTVHRWVKEARRRGLLTPGVTDRAE